MDLYNNLVKYGKKDIYPFHMPGHKRNKNFFKEELFKLDITEINDMDNLHNPTGIIKDFQQMLAKAFGADFSFFLVNGSSSGIIAAIMTLCKDGDYILASRNSHQSFFSALVYSGAIPVYINQEITNHAIIGGIDPSKVEAEILKNPKIKAIFLTSPTYEGIVSDISEISKVAKKYNKILIVDEAHGAHFQFSDFFPETALSLGADIVVQSLHKTLPTLGQSSVLHISGNKVNLNLLKQNLKFIQTSSPSYIFMGVADKCIREVMDKPLLFKNYIYLLSEFRNNCSNLKNIKLIGKELKNKFFIYDVDLAKLTFLTKISGTEFEALLRDKYKIQLEMSSLNYSIAMTSIADSKEGFDRLFTAIKQIDSKSIDFQMDINLKYPKNIPKLQIPPRQSVYMKKRKIKILESSGFISAENIIPYPPGVPIVTIGELISDEIIDFLILCQEKGISLMGIEDGNFINIIEN